MPLGLGGLPGSGASTGGGAVDSVSNSDGTLTISPTTGVVVASLNLSHANTWAATQTFGVGFLKGTDIQAVGAAGIEVKNSIGANVAIFGAGPGIGTSLLGATNIGSGSADYIQIAGGTGSTVFTATGTSTDISIHLTSKGAGGTILNVGANEIARTDRSGSFSGVLIGTTTPINPSGSTPTRLQSYNATNNVNVASFGGGPGSGNTLTVFNASSSGQQIRAGFITNYSVINFVNPAASGGLLQSGGNLTYDVATSSDFIWSQNSVGTVLMRLNSTGLGIGITPTTTLHVHNASGNSQIQITDGASGSTNADGLEIGTNFSDGSMYIWNNEATALRFGTNNSERVRIESSGNVGIGTGATVSAKLHTLATTEQLRLGYDSSNYFSTTVGSTGGVTFNAVGAGSLFTFSDGVTINGTLTLSAQNIETDTTTGMKIWTATTQKGAFWNATPIVQPAHIADPTGGAVQDAESRTAIAAINAMLAATGLTAAS